MNEFNSFLVKLWGTLLPIAIISATIMYFYENIRIVVFPLAIILCVVFATKIILASNKPKTSSSKMT